MQNLTLEQTAQVLARTLVLGRPTISGVVLPESMSISTLRGLLEAELGLYKNFRQVICGQHPHARTYDVRRQDGSVAYLLVAHLVSPLVACTKFTGVLVSVGDLDCGETSYRPSDLWVSGDDLKLAAHVAPGCVWYRVRV